jgi:initiation factor 1A
MVRNLKGGTGTKALARKHSTSNSGSAGNIRLPSCNAEQLAFVSKMFGNGMCEVFTNDNVRLLAHIRNKFRGRQKRQNTISAASVVLVGLREWETSRNNCDILFVYDSNDISSLYNLPHIQFNHIADRLSNLHSSTDNHHKLNNYISENNDNDNDNLAFHDHNLEPQLDNIPNNIHIPNTFPYTTLHFNIDDI